MIFASQGSSFWEVPVPKQSSSGRQQLLVFVVLERQSDPAEELAFSKGRVHQREEEIRMGEGIAK